MKHYYLIMVSHGESEPDEIKIEISLEDLWKFLNNSNYNRDVVESFWSITQLNKFQVSLSTPWNSFRETTEADPTSDGAIDRNENLSISSIADVINRLCNDLSSSEYYVVDVIWIVSSLSILPSFQDNIQLYGALKRLTKWHKARLTICNCEEILAPSFTWSRVLPLQIVKYPFAWEQILYDNVFWRGGIMCSSQTSGANTRLTGFQLRSTKQSNFPVDIYDDFITVADELPLTSIPPYMVSSSKFELLLPIPAGCLTSHLEKSWNFLSEANSTTTVGLLLRAEMRKHSEDEHLDFVAWKKYNIEGDSNEYVEERSRRSKSSRLFILIGDGLRTSYSATLYALRGPVNFNSITCQQILLQEAYQLCHCSKDHEPQMLNNLLHLSCEDVKQLGKYLAEWQPWMMGKWITANGQPGSEVAGATGAFIINRFKERRIGLRSTHAKQLSTNNVAVETKSTLMDVINWRENKYLQRVKDLSSNCNVLDKIDGLSTHVISNEVSKITIDDIITRVKAYVKAKADELTTKRPSTRQSPKSYCPSVESRLTHDIFYNSDQSCEKTMERNVELSNRIINVETVSLLNPSSSDSGSESHQRLLLTPVKFKTDKENSCQKPKRRRLENMFKKDHIMEAKTVIRLPLSSAVKNQIVKPFELNERHLKKLRIAVVDALALHGIKLEHQLFRVCAKKLFEICKTFTKDVIGRGRTSEQFEKLAMSHVQQVILFHRKLTTQSSRG